MRLRAKTTPYSSVVTLIDELGASRFVVMFSGTARSSRITMAQNDALIKQFAAFVEEHGLTAPEQETEDADAD